MAGKIYVVFIVAFALAFADHAFCGVFFRDGFESGDTSNPSYSVSGAAWGAHADGGADDVSVSSEQAHSGTYSIKFLFAGNADSTDDAWAQQYFNLGTPVTEVFIQFYIYFSNNYIIRDLSGSATDRDMNTKLGALWGDTYSDPVAMTIEYEFAMKPQFKTKVAGYPTAPDCSGAVGYVSNPLIHSTSTSITSMRGRWTCIEYHYRLDSGSGDGAFQMWIDGSLEVDVQSLAWAGAPCSPGYLLNGYLMGWSNSGFAEDTAVYIDDVTFSTSRIGGPQRHRYGISIVLQPEQ